MSGEHQSTTPAHAHLGVHSKLQAVRKELHQMDLEKTGVAKNDGKVMYRYFELQDFLPTAIQLFEKHKLCPVCSFGTDLATLTITDIEGGGVILITSPMAKASLRGCHEIQNVGAVETYQRRYLYMAALELVEHDALEEEPPEEGKGSDKEELPPYSSTDFDANLPTWKKAIQASSDPKAKAEQLVTTMQGQYTLTPRQIKLIKELAIAKKPSAKG